ncbi:hypothetical protein EDD22DRAFT_951549 [Suillus occidentalis]|nr:hypothetical protein EDD22DRAFT_951549 [Suillus occidentalis]
MEDIVARGVEAVLRCVFINKEFPVINKCSPQRRKMEQEEIQQEKAIEASYERDFLLGEVWRLFKDIFGISQDANFIVHELVSHQDVYAYEYEDGQVPIQEIPPLISKMDTNHPEIAGSSICSLKNCRKGVVMRVGHSGGQKSAQPKVTAKSALETPTEVEERLIMKKDETLKSTHQMTHWKNKYLCRATVLDYLIKQISNENREDLPAWQWLQQLVKFFVSKIWYGAMR